MATRLYFPSSGTALITPSTWNFGVQVNPLTLKGGTVLNDGSAMTSKAEATGTTNPTARAMLRYVYGPLAAQTIAGTIKAQMRGLESAAGANATPAIAVKIVGPDGVDRAVLLAQTASDSATAGHEFSATALTNQKFEDAAESAAIALTSQAALDGDYLVVEIGFRSATGTTRNITLSYGNDSTTDLPEDTSTVTANNPWIEFSQSLAWQVPVFVRYPQREQGPFPFPRTTPPFVPTINETVVALSGVAATLAIGALGTALALTPTGVSATGGVGLGPTTVDVATSGVAATGAIGTTVPGFTFSLSGLSSASELGSLGFSGWSEALSGVSATGAVGTPTPTTTQALSGNSSTGAVGSVAPTVDVPLTGVQSTSALGSISAGGAGSAGLTSVLGTGAVGTVAPALDVALSGLASTGAVGTAAPEVSVALTGVQASGQISSLSVGVRYFDRPQVVRGPFPFPKTRPAFDVTTPSVTSVALTGVEAIADINDLQAVDVTLAPLTGVQASALIGNVQPSTPGSSALVGVESASGVTAPTPNITVALSGVEAAGSVGSVGPRLLVFDRFGVAGPFPFLPSSGMFQFRGRAKPVLPASQSITVILTGVQTTTSIGGLAASSVSALTGTQAVGAVQQPVPGIAVAPTGVQASGATGQVGLAQNLTGVAAAGAPGSVGVSVTIALIGVEAFGQLGGVAAQANTDVTQGLSGVVATGSVGSLEPGISVAAGGTAATGSVGTVRAAADVLLTSVGAVTALGSPAASGSASASLAGLQATLALGSVAPEVKATALGVEASGMVGAPGVDVVVALTGVEAVCELGTFLPDGGSILDFAVQFRDTIDIVVEMD